MYLSKKKWVASILSLLETDNYFLKATKLIHEFTAKKDKLSKVAINNLRQEEFARFINNELVSNVVFLIDDKKVYASKLILAARSQYFETLLLNGMKETRQIQIEIKDVEYDVFLKIMEFLYTRYTSINSSEEALKVLVTADAFQMDGLKNVCEAHLGSHISSDSVQHLYDLSKKFNAFNLKNSCMAWVVDNLEILWHGEESKAFLRQFLRAETILNDLFNYIAQFFE